MSDCIEVRAILLFRADDWFHGNWLAQLQNENLVFEVLSWSFAESRRAIKRAFNQRSR